MKRVELKNWTVNGYYPYTVLMGKNVETGVPLAGVTQPLSVSLPRSLYSALMKAGVIKDLKKDLNSLSAEWVKDRWWLYETSFSFDGEACEKQNLSVLFESVDYYCAVYLNGREIFRHEGASAPFRVSLADVSFGVNRLSVLVRAADIEMGQIGYTSKVNTQRPRFDYKWDFCPRLVNVGIYRRVFLEYGEAVKIDGIVFNTISTDTPSASVNAVLCAKKAGNYIFGLKIADGRNIIFSEEKQLSLIAGENLSESIISVKEAQLWNINERGSHKTYKLTVYVSDGEKELDRKEKTVGFRTVCFVQNPGAPKDAYPYTAVVNGKKEYLKGFNMTPLDFLLGEETKSRYNELLSAARDAHANIIRVWGGGIIECDYFYELCSQYGLLVWQDMPQSSSGMDNIPPEDEKYLSLLEQSVRFAVLGRGNYPCFAVLCGGNEIFGKDSKPVGYENANMRRIASVLQKYNSDIFFMPSTASGPVQEASLTDSSKNHDIHGPWLYLGEDYYRHYNKLKCLFAGEFGCNGMSSASTLRKFISKKFLKPVSASKSPVLRHHGEIWDLNFRITEIFGEITDFDDYVAVGEYLQKAGIDYAVCSHRRNAPYQSGCMIWQLNEMFPNVASTALIDYYGNKKAGYYAAKRAFDKTFISFSYDKITYSPGEKINLKVYITSQEAVDGRVSIKVETTDKTKILEQREIGVIGTREVASVSEICPNCGYVAIYTEYTTCEKAYRNEVIFMVKSDGNCDKSAIKAMKEITDSISKEL